jgi:PIN domain nuclease of toxin-antitoxin system
LTYLDTHLLVWLYIPRRDLMSGTAVKALDDDDLAISPIVLLELEYLKEIGRVLVDPSIIVGELHRTIGLRICGLEFSRVVESARKQSWTRDPFDRLIVGHAVAAGMQRLVTKDAPILANYPKAVW